MECGGSLLGFVGFDSVRVKKVWREQIIALLRIFGEILANALARKRTEEALRRTTDTLNNILRSATEYAIAATNLDLRVIHYNPAAERIFGMRAGEILGRSVVDIHRDAGIPPVRVTRALETVARVGIWETELKLTGPAGMERIIHAVVMPMRNEEGIDIGYVLLARDITDQKRAEEQRDHLESQLRHAHKLQAVGRLAAGVAHDFNSLLMVILGNIELLERKFQAGQGGPGTAGTAELEQIHNAIERGRVLIQKLLVFGRTRRSKLQVVDPNRLISETRRMLHGLLGTQIEVQTNLAADVKHINADPGQLEQAVMNLVLNARDAMPFGGVLTIETANATFDEEYVAAHPEAAMGEHVRITVSDTGSGMTEETRQQAFEPFFTTKAVDKGSGLGLSIVHGIVNQAGGHIEVSSTLGKGAVFNVYFPAVE
jgi:PAS domain S-box-containing protein